MLKRLIIVRHGDYGSDDHLNIDGKREMNKLGDELMTSIINGQRGFILTSPINRAFESAEILRGMLGFQIVANEVLFSNGDHPVDLIASLELIRSYKNIADILIVVTHLEYTNRFHQYFGKNELGVEFQFGGIGKGQAWDIDCEQKTITAHR